MSLSPPETETEVDEEATSGRRIGRSRKSQVNHWTRVAHVYTSMLCFLVVLFFAVTGLTLNHPNWTFGGSGSQADKHGTLPATWKTGTNIDWLVVSDYLRSTYDLSGDVSEHDDNDTDATITFKGPGFEADAFINVATGSYDLSIAQAGPLSVLNDLHKGRDAAKSWRWLIDVSAIFLIVIALSGIGLQLFLKRRRRAAMWTAAGGAALFVLLAWWGLR